MLSAAALLTSVAVALSGQTVSVRCKRPPDVSAWGNVVGWTYRDELAEDPSVVSYRVYLRYCGATVALSRPAIDTFAHELLHVEHWPWGEARVDALEHEYGAEVLDAVELAELPPPVPMVPDLP